MPSGHRHATLLITMLYLHRFTGSEYEMLSTKQADTMIFRVHLHYRVSVSILNDLCHGFLAQLVRALP